MSISYLDPFTGIESKTCSVAASYAAKVQQQQGVRLTEAEWEQHQHYGTWGVIKGKYQNGDLPDLPFAEYKGVGGAHYKIGVKDGKLTQYSVNSQTTFYPSLETLDSIVDMAGKGGGGLTDWKWLGQNTPDKPNVSLGSKSVGSLTDQDAAALFVKVKDDIAKAKGINIKGVNPALDNDVYNAVAKQTGYTASEIAAKVNAYKATGKKLSALKKKVKAGKAKTLDLDNHLDIPKKTVPPQGVPVEAAQNTVKAAVNDLKASLPKYTDEDVAKAYIKAKDQVAANPSNPWTLYTQNNKDFDDAIYSVMEKFYDVHLDPYRIQTQIARYLGEGNKLSVLKKKMAKQGEYLPQADTLKKSKKASDAFTSGSKTQTLKQIDEMKGFYEPAKYKPYSMTSAQEDFVFSNASSQVYALVEHQHLYDLFSGMKKNSVWGGKPPDILSLVRAYDKKKAAQLGIPNGNFYEKKLAEFASSPKGSSYIKTQQALVDLEADLPPLPADSATFRTLEPSEASALQKKIRARWDPDELSALQQYTGSGYTTINGALRRGSLSSHRSTINSMIKGMDPLPQNMLATRGCSFEQFGLRSYENALQSVGKTVSDEGFLSTSVGGNPAFGGSVRIEAELPRGSYGAYVNDVSRHRGENEYIVAPGTKFKVLRVEKKGYQVVVRVRAIPGSHTKRV